MAGKGSFKLRSSTLSELYFALADFQTKAEDALYEQFKTAYKISHTNYMRGAAADSFKTYLSQGTINIISGLMDIVADTATLAQVIAEAFYVIEESANGVIAKSRLESIKTDLKGYKKTFSGMEAELSGAITEASNYISTTGLKLDGVIDSYTKVETKIKEIDTDINDVDSQALTDVALLISRIESLQLMVTNTMGRCYRDGKFVPDKILDLSNQSWYEKQTNLALNIKLQEDPFAYEAGAVAISEKQWAAGLCSDVYAYAGYTWLGAEGEVGLENGTAYAKGAAVVFSANAYAQLTEYIKTEGEAKVAYAEGEVKVGDGQDGYYGGHISGEIGLLKIDGKATIGTDGFNGYVKGDVEVLTADGKASFEFDRKSGEFAVGVDASATAASASGSAGVSFLEVGYKEHKQKGATGAKPEKLSLFKVEAGASASAGGAFAMYAESEKAIETRLFNVNATSIKLKGVAGLGFDLNITVPTIYWKWPW